MARSFYINDTEVFPDDLSGNSIVKSREEYFRVRTSLKGPLVFIDNNRTGHKDYTFINGLSKDDRHELKIINSGISTPEYIGEFSKLACEFDDQQKKVSFTPQLKDAYTIIQENEDIEVDIIEGPATSVYMERYTYFYFWGRVTTNPDSEPSNYLLFWHDEDYVASGGYNGTGCQILAQERIILDYDPGGTWVEINKIDSNLTLYGRKPSGLVAPDYDDVVHPGKNGAIRNEFIVNPAIPDIYASTSIDYDFLYATYKNDSSYTILFHYPLQVQSGAGTEASIYTIPFFAAIKTTLYDTIPKNSLSIDQVYDAYGLKDSIGRVLNEAVPKFTGEVKSTLLFYDNPETNGPDYITGAYGTEYVVNSNKQSRLIYDKYLIQNTDFKYASASNPATIGKVSLKKILDYIFARFKAISFIDNDGNFRIEHISYNQISNIGIDISDENTLLPTWKYDNIDTPNRAVYDDQNAWNDDFTQKQIVYGNIPASEGVKEKKQEISAQFFITDVDGANENLDLVPNDGFIFIEVDNSKNVVKDIGEFSGDINIQNVGLSWANCLERYHRYEVFTDEFIMNGKTRNAETEKYLRLQENVNFVSSTKPNMSEFITTNIGTGRIDELSYPISANEKEIKMKILYPTE